MVQPFPCLVALLLLGWVVLLKTKIQELTRENRKLRTKLELGVRELMKDVEVGQGAASCGKTEGTEPHPAHVVSGMHKE